ncbi:MAG: Hsp70 family protein, partial [Myxococcales bacterium]|nr:Hsp70 family protein [Myxococcales bacterium]
AITLLEIDQVVAPGEVGTKTSLPSFLLMPSEHEMATGSMALPWNDGPDHCVGALARSRGSELPHRLVSSAKSWLSYAGVDRSADILPWRGSEEAPEDEKRISPVGASARYLAHLRATWDSKMPAPMAEQDILLTVPASFDVVAKELTVAAAREAGLGNVTLLEEPQAAFYSWLAKNGDAWRTQLKSGDLALVCDIGGGTSDFSLISANDDGEGNLTLERVAVGEHILLGGDNMDLTLAQVVIKRFGDKGKKLKPSQYRALVLACARAKELLLSKDGPEKLPISILGAGSKLIGGALKSELKSEDISILLKGFFPEVASGDKPKQRRALGLKELGLPYATDPAITRHLSAFLAKHEKEPTVVLWNGGVMKGERVRQSISETLEGWFGKKLPALEGTNLNLAVAHGAAYYGLVRQGKGIRIRGGTARSYYIGVEGSAPAIPGFEPPIKALCVAPFGMEEGSAEDLPEEEMGLVVGEPTTFRFFASTNRPNDPVGALVDPEEVELHEIAPIEAHLAPESGHESGDVVPVYLAANVTELGTLELWGYAKDGEGRWKLEYSLRDAPEEQ